MNGIQLANENYKKDTIKGHLHSFKIQKGLGFRLGNDHGEFIELGFDFQHLHYRVKYNRVGSDLIDVFVEKIPAVLGESVMTIECKILTYEEIYIAQEHVSNVLYLLDHLSLFLVRLVTLNDPSMKDKYKDNEAMFDAWLENANENGNLISSADVQKVKNGEKVYTLSDFMKLSKGDFMKKV